MLDDATSRLIRDIYACVESPDRWDGVLNAIVARTGSYCALLSAVHLESGAYRFMRFHGPDGARFLDAVDAYEESMHLHDPMLRQAARLPGGRFVTQSEVLEPTDVEYLAWYKNAFGASDTTVGYSALTGGLALGLSIHSAKARDGHAPHELRLFRMLFDHVEQAVRLAALPPDLEDDERALLLVTGDGRLARASRAARTLLASKDGVLIEDGRLAPTDRSAVRRLDAAVRSALAALTEGHAGTTVRLPRPSGRPALLARVEPMPLAPEPLAALHPAALITLIEPDAGPTASTGAHWAKAFALTPAEVRLAAALLADEIGLRPTADRLGIAYATARVQLASIFNKVNVRSQAQLVRLLTRLGGCFLALWSTVDQAAFPLA